MRRETHFHCRWEWTATAQLAIHCLGEAPPSGVDVEMRGNLAEEALARRSASDERSYGFGLVREHWHCTPLAALTLHRHMQASLCIVVDIAHTDARHLGATQVRRVEQGEQLAPVRWIEWGIPRHRPARARDSG